MKKISVLVKQVLMSTLTAGFLAFSITSCTDETDNLAAGSNQAPEGADTALLEAYGLTYQNFISADDVIILNADTTQLSISKAYADKMGITSFVNHPMGIWHKMENLPYIRKATGEKLVGDRYIVDVVPATVAEIMGDKKANLQTDIYVNPDTRSVQTRAASSNIPEYAAKYVDDNNVIHPAVIHMTDPYGYDQQCHFRDDQPAASQTRAAATGEYRSMTAEEMLGSQTRWGCKKRLLGVNTKFERPFKLAAKGSKDTVQVTIGTEIDFELNYFLTLEGGIKWGGFLPKPYLEKFETGVDGHFDFTAEVEFAFEKKWSLEDKLKFEICKFDAFSYTFFIGPVPVNISVSPNLFAKFDGEISGKVTTGFKYEYSNEFMGGARYTDDNGWEAIGYFEEKANDFTITPATLAFKFKCGMGLYLGADILVYKSAGPEFAVGPHLGGELNAVVSPFTAKEASDIFDFNGKIQVDINAVLGAKLKVLGYEIAETEVEIPMAGPWVLKKYPSDGSEHKVGDTEGVKTAAPTVTEWPNFYKQIENSRYGQSYKEYMQSLIKMVKEINDIDDAKARQIIIRRLQKDYRNEPEATTASIDFFVGSMRLYVDEVRAQYREHLYQQAAASGDTETMNAMNWEDIIEELIHSGVYGQSPEWLHSVSNDLYQWFKKEFNREPSKADKNDLDWLRKHINNFDFFKASMIGYNEEVYQNTVLPFLKRIFTYEFQRNNKLALEAADEAYRTYVHDYRCQPDAEDQEMKSLFNKIYGKKFTDYTIAKDNERKRLIQEEEAEQQKKEDAAKMRATFLEMHKAYFDKYNSVAGSGFNEAVRTFRQTFKRRPTLSTEDMNKLSEIFVNYMTSKGLTV